MLEDVESEVTSFIVITPLPLSLLHLSLFPDCSADG